MIVVVCLGTEAAIRHPTPPLTSLWAVCRDRVQVRYQGVLNCARNRVQQRIPKVDSTARLARQGQWLERCTLHVRMKNSLLDCIYASLSQSHELDVPVAKIPAVTNTHSEAGDPYALTCYSCRGAV